MFHPMFHRPPPMRATRVIPSTRRHPRMSRQTRETAPSTRGSRRPAARATTHVAGASTATRGFSARAGCASSRRAGARASPVVTPGCAARGCAARGVGARCRRRRAEAPTNGVVRASRSVRAVTAARRASVAPAASPTRRVAAALSAARTISAPRAFVGLAAPTGRRAVRVSGAAARRRVWAGFAGPAASAASPAAARSVARAAARAGAACEAGRLTARRNFAPRTHREKRNKCYVDRIG